MIRPDPDRVPAAAPYSLPSSRDADGRTFDIIVIGGGITGAATARDAALRGLDVLLLERDDYASGTSSRSSKLLHGGLRYLRQRAFRLVREACRERELMGQLAPHLSHVRPFIYLLYPDDPEALWQLRAGLTLYDRFSGNPRERRHRILKPGSVLHTEPHVRSDGLRGGGSYHDFLTDDARLTIDTVTSARRAGAVTLNHTPVVRYLRGGNGQVVGVEAEDRLTGGSLAARGGVVINTTGVWSDDVRDLDGVGPNQVVRPSKGVHMVVRRDRLPVSTALFFLHPQDRRNVFVIPALDPELVYVGTTDTFYDGPLGDVAPCDGDIAYLVAAARYIVPDSGITDADVVGNWAGLRPLVAGQPGSDASSISREHLIHLSPDGLINVVGGKLSTARAMAEGIVDMAVERLDQVHGRPRPRACSTAEIPIAGGIPYELEDGRDRLCTASLTPETVDRLATRYGSEVRGLAGLLEGDPTLGRPVSHGITRLEIAYSARVEQARTVTDVLARRTSLFFWNTDAARSVADVVACEMGRELAWDAPEQQRHLEAHRRWMDRNSWRRAC